MKKTIAIPVLIAVIFYGGCSVIGIMGTPTDQEIKIPAEYDLAKNKDSKILVLVNQSILVKSQVNIRYYLTETVNKQLAGKTKIPAANVISYDNLAKYRSSKINFEQLSPVELGKGLGANLVLVIDIYAFEIEQFEDTNYYKGSINARAALFDVSAGAKLWPESDVRIIMVPGQIIDAATIGFMRKLDVKEIHGYNATRGLQLIKLSAIGAPATRKPAPAPAGKRK